MPAGCDGGRRCGPSRTRIRSPLRQGFNNNSLAFNSKPDPGLIIFDRINYVQVLLALLLVEPNRRVAVEEGAVAAAVEAVVAAGSSSGTSTADRALAALELMCTVEEGASEVRRHALAAPAMGGAVENLLGRGRECAIGVLAAAYAGERAMEAPEEVVRAVMVAMQGECSARGRRKGGALLRALQECGRLDVDFNFDG